MKTDGYVAITVTIILSLLMLILAGTLGMSALLTRFETVDFSNKKSSYFMARSCLDHALLKLAVNGSYAGNENLNINSYQCSILPIETLGPDKIIKARSQIMGATTNLKLTVNSSSLATITLEEAVKF
ncbi:MAG: hypothetical protein AAB771_01445 [Patescibacteria group bacterium]